MMKKHEQGANPDSVRSGKARRACLVVSTVAALGVACGDSPPTDEATSDVEDDEHSADYAGSALIVTDGGEPNSPGTLAIEERLARLGFEIDRRSESELTAADADERSLVIVADGVTSTRVGEALRAVPVPVVVASAALYGDLHMTGNVRNSDYATVSIAGTRLLIEEWTHPIAGGLDAGEVSVLAVPGNVGWGLPAPEAAVIGSVDERPVLFAYDAGEAMVGSTAPARRVGMAFVAGEGFTTQGAKLTDAAVRWAAASQPARLAASSSELPPSVGPRLFAVNDVELSARLAIAKPGQHIVLTGARYSASRTLGHGKVLVGNDMRAMPRVLGDYSLDGDGAIVHGLDFSGASVTMRGNRAKLLRSKIHGLGKRSPVVVADGDRVVVAYNEIYDWGTTATCGAARGLTVRAPYPNLTDGATRVHVYRNYIHDQIGFNPETCADDAEVISAGQTGASARGTSRFEGHFHHNLIVNCEGDVEGFGVKSSYSRFEYNHLRGVRGFNNRLGGYNTFVGNRIEGSRQPGGNRGGYRNLSLGEVFAGKLVVGGGTHTFHDGTVSYMQSDGTKIIGTKARAITVGIDAWKVWNLPAKGTLIEATNVAPTIGPEQVGTRNRWRDKSSMSVPQAASLTTADVGPWTTR